MIEQEEFAQGIRDAGAEVAAAEIDLARAEALEKQTFAKLMMIGEHQGNKTAAAQSRYADETDEMFQARLNRGQAKGSLAAAKANYLAAEVEFKAWQSKLASTRFEKRVYGT